MGRIDPMLGILIPLPENELAASGAGTYDSTFTQTGAGPGVDLPDVAGRRWSLVVTGGQDTEIEYIVLRGGYPGPGRGSAAAQVLVRKPSESNESYWRGWEEPVLLTGVQSPANYLDYTPSTVAIAVRPDTGEIVCVYEDGSGNAAASSFDPRSEVFTDGYDFGANQGLPAPIAMAADPSTPGRIILWAGENTISLAYNSECVAYYSDDSGATWDLYSVGWNASGSVKKLSGVVPHPTADWFGFSDTELSYYSIDNGVSWQYVGSFASIADAGTIPTACLGPKGFVIGYVRVTDRKPCVRIIGSARNSVSAATEIELEATPPSIDHLLVVADEDGTLYAYGFEAQASVSGTGGFAALWRSLDGGYNWDEYGANALGNGTSTTDTTALDFAQGVASRGSIFVAGAGDSGASGLLLLQFGGWSNVVHGSYVDALLGAELRFGWCNVATGSIESACVYYPVDSPANLLWAVGNSGTFTASRLHGAWEIYTAASSTYIITETIKTGAADDYIAGEIILQCPQGKAVSGTPEAYFELSLLDSGTTGYDMRIYFGTDGFVVKDSTTSRSTVTGLDLANYKYHFRAFIRQDGSIGRGKVWYRKEGTDYWAATGDITLTSGARTTSIVRFEHLTSADTTTRLYMLAAAGHCGFTNGLDAADEFGLGFVDGIRGHYWSRALPPAGYPYPVPLLADAVDVGRMYGTGGPAYYGEAGHIPVRYEYAVENVHPKTAPSPRNGWRATDTSEAKWTYEDEEARARFLGAAFALVALNGSFRTAYLEVDTAAFTFETIGTLDKGVDVTFARTGRDIVASGATGVSRYIQENEIAGGYFIFPGTPNVARRIESNSAGYFSAGAGQQCHIVCSGLAGTEASSGTGTIVWPSGVMICYPDKARGDYPHHYYRIRIPSGQIVPADRGSDGATAAYDAGKLFAARVIGIGTEPMWTHTTTVDYPLSLSRSRDGSPALASLGPARRVVEYGFEESNAGMMRTLGAAPDFVGVGTGGGIGTGQDAWVAVPRALALGAGDPLVLVPRLPSADATLTDSSLFVYGYCVTTTLSLGYATGGWEGVDEIVAVGGLAVEELA